MILIMTSPCHFEDVVSSGFCQMEGSFLLGVTCGCLAISRTAVQDHLDRSVSEGVLTTAHRPAGSTSTGRVGGVARTAEGQVA